MLASEHGRTAQRPDVGKPARAAAAALAGHKGPMQMTAWLAASETIVVSPFASLARVARRGVSYVLGRSQDDDPISVPPVSEEWLVEHEADASKHSDNVGGE